MSYREKCEQIYKEHEFMKNCLIEIYKAKDTLFDDPKRDNAITLNTRHLKNIARIALVKVGEIENE